MLPAWYSVAGKTGQDPSILPFACVDPRVTVGLYGPGLDAATKTQRLAPLHSCGRESTQAVMSTSLVSLTKNRPTTKVIIAITTGYQRQEKINRKSVG